jgi:hypothetical protein
MCVRLVWTVFAGVLALLLPTFAAAQESDHQRLSRHFAALAAQYAADAADHEALAKVYRARPNASETKRPGSVDTAVHCERLATYARKAAADARQMAESHDRMASLPESVAAAAAVSQPRSGDLLPAAEVRALVGSAALLADHQKLARHYTALAARFDDDATRHEALAKALRASSNSSETKRPGAPDTAAHCERLAGSARQAAGEARQLAVAHQHMAAAK